MTEKRERRALRRFKKAVEWIVAILSGAKAAKDGVDELRRK